MKGPTLSVLPPAIIQYNENYVKETILFNIANLNKLERWHLKNQLLDREKKVMDSYEAIT